MQLYRAQSDQPEFSTSQLEQELALLEHERDSGPPGEYMVDAFQRMGKGKYLRLVELRKVVKDDQFFSNNLAEERATAGEHNFIISMAVPEEVATKHQVSREAVLAVGDHAPEAGNHYAFQGYELAEHRLDWQIEVRIT